MGGGTGVVAFRPVSRQRYAFLVGEQEFDTRIVSDKERRHCPAAQSSRRWSGEIALQFCLGRAWPGHLPLRTVVTKTGMRGSSPRKTTSKAYVHLSQILSSSSSAFASLRSGVSKPSRNQP